MTKKKEKPSSKLKWMQRFFSVAGNIAPVTTIHVLVRLFFTPKRQKLRPVHIELKGKADTIKFEVDEFRNPKKKLKLKVYTWGNGDKTVLLVHGWDAKAFDYYKMIPVLVEQGYKVIAFDGPAHGGSEGERSNLIDFKEVMYKLIKKKIGVPYAIIGHSMGGGAATYLLMDYDIKVQRLITITMPAVSKRFFEAMFHIMKVPPKMQKVFFEGMEQEFGEPVERLNLIERKEPIKADKILCIYDEEDEVISLKDVRDMLAKHPEMIQMNVKGVGHYKVIKNKQVIDAITEFLK